MQLECVVIHPGGVHGKVRNYSPLPITSLSMLLLCLLLKWVLSVPGKKAFSLLTNIRIRDELFMSSVLGCSFMATESCTPLGGYMYQPVSSESIS